MNFYMGMYYLSMIDGYVIWVKTLVLTELAKEEKKPNQTIYHQSLFYGNCFFCWKLQIVNLGLSTSGKGESLLKVWGCLISNVLKAFPHMLCVIGVLKMAIDFV